VLPAEHSGLDLITLWLIQNFWNEASEGFKVETLEGDWGVKPVKMLVWNRPQILNTASDFGHNLRFRALWGNTKAPFFKTWRRQAPD